MFDNTKNNQHGQYHVLLSFVYFLFMNVSYHQIAQQSPKLYK